MVLSYIILYLIADCHFNQRPWPWARHNLLFVDRHYDFLYDNKSKCLNDKLSISNSGPPLIELPWPVSSDMVKLTGKRDVLMPVSRWQVASGLQGRRRFSGLALLKFARYGSRAAVICDHRGFALSSAKDEGGDSYEW